MKKIIITVLSISFLIFAALSLASCDTPAPEGGVTYSGTTVIAADKTATTLTVKDGTTTVGDGAFDGCSSLSSLTLPDSVSTVKKGAFDGCTSLIKEEGGVLYAAGWAIGIADGFGGGAITILDGTVGIAEEAFANAVTVTSLAIPDSVKHINARALFGTNGLSDITLPFIGASQSGTYSTHLGYIFGAFSVEKNARYLPEALKSVTLTGSERIYDGAFAGCGKIERIILPDTLTFIGKRAFDGCTSLSQIKIPNGVSTIEDRAFINCISLKTATLPTNDDFAVIPQYMFAYCSSLEEIVIPSSVKEVRACAFGMCESLASLEFLATEPISEIGQQAFDGCKSLTSLSLSVGVIGKAAFQRCTRLETVNTTEGLITLSDYAFNGCIALKSISIADTVEHIGANVFHSCSQLRSAPLPSSLKTVGENAFYGCASVSEFDIPDTVISIGTNAFDGCAREVFITVDGLTYIDGWICNAAPSITTATVGLDVRGICDGAFDGCKNLSRIVYEGTEAEWLSLIGNSKNDRLRAVTSVEYSG